jgi:LPXTG-site transpeptidase (sortase) family protein
MKTKTYFKFILPVIFYFGIVAGGYFFFITPKLNTEDKTVDKIVKTVPDNSFGWKFPVAKFPLTSSDGKQIAYSSIRDPGGIAEGLPVRLKIPVIGVDSAIEDAYITPDGRMDVPAGTVNVAWFALGPKPGKEGSAVIGGHYGEYQANKGPTVFFNLDKLKAGDKVYIEDDKGETLTFVVRRIQLFDRNADSTSVFTSGDGKAHLNLITCEGIWNQVNDSYPDRRIVFTDAIPTEKTVSVKTAAPIAATAIPVVTTPKPTTAPTQIPAISPSPSISSAPIATEKSPALPLMLIKSAQSLYATPMDGIITSLLLILILFLSYKIIRRYIK